MRLLARGAEAVAEALHLIEVGPQREVLADAHMHATQGRVQLQEARPGLTAEELLHDPDAGRAMDARDVELAAPPLGDRGLDGREPGTLGGASIHDGYPALAPQIVEARETLVVQQVIDGLAASAAEGRPLRSGGGGQTAVGTLRRRNCCARNASRTHPLRGPSNFPANFPAICHASTRPHATCVPEKTPNAARPRRRPATKSRAV